MLEADNEKLKKDLSECDMSCAATKGQKLPQRRVRGDFSRKKKEYTIGVDPAKPKSDKTVFQILCPMCRKVVVIEKGKTTECCAVEFKCN